MLLIKRERFGTDHFSHITYMVPQKLRAVKNGREATAGEFYILEFTYKT